MAEQYSVEAFLKATDQGFTKTFQEAGDTVGTLEKKTAGFTDGFKNVMKTATSHSTRVRGLKYNVHARILPE